MSRQKHDDWHFEDGAPIPEGYVDPSNRRLPEAERVVEAWDALYASGGITGPAWDRVAAAIETLRSLLACRLCGHPFALHDNPGSECVADGCDCDSVP